MPIYGPQLEKGTGRRVVGHRPAAPGTVRKELGTLQAAVNYCAAEGHTLAAPRVTLPPKPETTGRALTRAEAAKLIRAARSIGAEHIARFILVSLYTGTRRDATLALCLHGPNAKGGWFDLERGVLYRRGTGETDSAKRRTPAPIPRPLLAHARRWRASGQVWAVEWRGLRVGSIKTAWRSTVTAAGLSWAPTPHTLKHTAISWAIENGMKLETAAAYFGTSAATIERTYWHHSPHYLADAVAIMERRVRR
ncbi:tyrosine-type recombinase/integrase [Pararhodobacter zhoushanensis]|uniref:tyrosine-type recombinase/integrase n=1 Tax=Pararhodobacter zhoushanensis TaxID=2479545 RepID=UPI0013DFE2B0|nr:site-specific integrase [Pararhodobacter zhoushanensis]